MATNPCLTCGACCACFRASFYWRECDDVQPGGVPAHLTDDLTPFRRVMKGTNSAAPRCAALVGTIGQEVRCSIYEHRPTVCRGFVPSYCNGVPDERCDKARKMHRLLPLTPDDWHEQDHDDEPTKPHRPRRRMRPAA